MRNPLEVWKSPFRELERAFGYFPEMSRRMDEKLNLITACEVSEEDNKYFLKFDMPGITKDQVKIELADNQLTVSAERKEEAKRETRKMYLEELSYGSYMRSFTLPATVDGKKVDAKFENGVLSITIPKIVPSKAKQIEIH